MPDLPLHAPFAGTVISIAHETNEHHRRRAAGRARGDEDGARDRAGRRRRRPQRRGRGRRHGRRGSGARGPRPGSGERSRPKDTSAAPDAGRDDLEAVRARHAQTLDAARPQAVAKRHGQGKRTARENLDDLIDPGSFVEYGPLMFAAQERRRTGGADRTHAGGRAGRRHGDDRRDAGGRHLLRLHRARRHAGDAQPPEEGPAVRDRRAPPAAGRAVRRGRRRPARRRRFAARRRTRLPRVPPVRTAQRARPASRDRIGLLLRRQRGAARVLRRRDRHRRLEHRHGRAGDDRGRRPRRVRPADVGPIDVQDANGVVDLRVQTKTQLWRPPSAICRTSTRTHASRGRGAPSNATTLRDLIPVNRKRVYDIRTVVTALLDDVLELRRGFGAGIVTALAAHDGKPLGVIANNPAHLGGAIDADGADKAARFMQLCDAFDLPLLFLCDTPASWSVPRRRRPPPLDISLACSSRAPTSRPDRDDRPPQGLRPRCSGNGRGQLQGAAVHGRVADGRVRRNGAGGRGSARNAPRARGDRRPRRTRPSLRRRRHRRLRERQGPQHGRLLRDRRRDRSR